jgi:hypothetical protein
MTHTFTAYSEELIRKRKTGGIKEKQEWLAQSTVNPRAPKLAFQVPSCAARVTSPGQAIENF